MKKVITKFLTLSILCCAVALTSCKTAPKNEECNKSCCEQKPTGEELVIVAHVTAHPEFKDELLQAFQNVVKGTHTEEGNISYDLYEDVNNPLKFTFIEYWKSPAAINAHNASAHFQEFAKAIEGKADLDVTTMKHKY
jgi:quinol monooxygenase YgiN